MAYLEMRRKDMPQVFARVDLGSDISPVWTDAELIRSAKECSRVFLKYCRGYKLETTIQRYIGLTEYTVVRDV